MAQRLNIWTNDSVTLLIAVTDLSELFLRLVRLRPGQSVSFWAKEAELQPGFSGEDNEQNGKLVQVLANKVDVSVDAAA